MGGDCTAAVQEKKAGLAAVGSANDHAHNVALPLLLSRVSPVHKKSIGRNTPSVKKTLSNQQPRALDALSYVFIDALLDTEGAI